LNRGSEPKSFGFFIASMMLGLRFISSIPIGHKSNKPSKTTT
jgi:hypothetical protein